MKHGSDRYLAISVPQGHPALLSIAYLGTVRYRVAQVSHVRCTCRACTACLARQDRVRLFEEKPIA